MGVVWGQEVGIVIPLDSKHREYVQCLKGIEAPAVKLR